MKVTKREAVLLAGFAAITVASLTVGPWFRNRDNGSTSLYRYASQPRKTFSILGKRFTFAWGKPTHIIEYEIKPNGLYTKYSHTLGYKWKGAKPNPLKMPPDTAITIHPDGTYTQNENGIYFVNSHSITFCNPIRRDWASPWVKWPLTRSYKSRGDYFSKDGFVFKESWFYFVPGGFSRVPPHPRAAKPWVEYQKIR